MVKLLSVPDPAQRTQLCQQFAPSGMNDCRMPPRRLGLCHALLVASTVILACSDAPTAAPCTVSENGRCWTDLGLDGHVVEVVASTGWGIFASTESAGVFRRESPAGSWIPVGLETPRVTGLLFASAPSPRLFASATSRGQVPTLAALFVSLDGGNTWLPTDDSVAALNNHYGGAWSVTADPSNPMRMFMGQQYSILRSRDGGVTWEYVLGGPGAAGLGTRALVVSESCGACVWGGGGDAFGRAVVFRSSDSGSTWAPSYLSPTSENAVLSLLQERGAAGRLFAGMVRWLGESDDGGSTWRQVVDAGFDASFVGIVRVDSTVVAGANIVEWSGEEPPVYRARLFINASGSEWERLDAPAELNGLMSIAVRGNTLLLGTRSGVWQLQR